MKLRKLSIRNYRGIQACDWVLDSNFIALVGPGDSTKTTLLDALGLVLTQRYNVTFTDADFFGCDSSKPILIEVVVVDLPTTLIEEQAHGKNRSGIRADGSLEHDPLDEDGVDECLIVRLTVDATLEPIWEVVRPGEAQGDRITAGQRGQLGFFRIGDYVDQHLRWGRGSALSNLTSSRTDATNAVVEAQRQARAAVSSLSGTPLHAAAAFAQGEVKKLGSGPFENLRPGLDPALGAGTAALVLHDGDIPLTQFGLGSRRLLSLSIQENALAGKSIVAIDEVESGLDPHRLAHLVRYLKARATSEELQVVLTTHSALVVESLSHDQLAVVRSDNGTTTATRVPAELEAAEVDVLQGVMRERPSALLAHAVIVGEGATEVGFFRELFREWDEERNGLTQLTSITAGLGLTNGGGDSQAPRRAKAIADLGYPTLLVIDGDVTTNSALVDEARGAGVVVVQWPEGFALEDVLCAELGTSGLQALVDLASEERSAEAVANAIGAHLGAVASGQSVEALFIEFGEDLVRSAIGRAAKGAKLSGEKQDHKAWFKREDRGEQLGAVVRKHSTAMVGNVTKTAVWAVRDFVYGSDLVVPTSAAS